MQGRLYGVSVGPGDPELMTLKAVRVIRSCEVVAVPQSGAETQVAWKIACEAVPEIFSKQKIDLLFPMTRDPGRLEVCHTAAAAQIAEQLEKGKSVAFLTLGDVSIYSTYAYMQERIRALGFEAEMVAGVPSFCAVASRLGISLTEAAKPLHIIPASYEGVDEGLDWNGVKVLMKTGKKIGQVKTALRERGLYQQARMVERCGMEGERILDSLDQADEASSYFSIIIAGERQPD